MKSYKLPICFFALIGLVACSGDNNSSNNLNEEYKTSTDSTYLITKNSAGIFQIGNPVPSADSLKHYRIEKKQQNRNTESGPVEETIYIISKNGTKFLILKPIYNHYSNSYAGTIDEIMVLSDKFHTKKGIGVASTINDFIAAYPSIKLWYTYVSFRYVMETETYSSLQFLLDEKDFIGQLEINDTMTELNSDDFKDDAQIFKIRIF